MISHDGKVESVFWWAEETGIPQKVIRNRIRAGWEVAKALTAPVDLRFSRRKT